LFVGFERQTKLVVCQLLGAHKYSLSYRLVSYTNQCRCCTAGVTWSYGPRHSACSCILYELQWSNSWLW